MFARWASIGGAALVAAIPLGACGGDDAGRAASSARDVTTVGEAPSSSPSSPGDGLAAPGSPPGASPSASASPAPERRRYVVAAIGDSLTDPRSHGGKYLDVLRERCPESRFESYGVGGNMVNMMRRRFLRDVFGEGADGGPPGAAAVGVGPERPAWTHVIVLGGLGDVLSNVTAGRTARAVQRDLAWMVAESRARGARAIVLTLPPWSGFRDYDGARAQMARDVNGWITAEAAEGRIDGTLDTRPVLSCGDPERLCDDKAFPDRLHWSEAGQRAVGEALHRALFADCR